MTVFLAVNNTQIYTYDMASAEVDIFSGTFENVPGVNLDPIQIPVYKHNTMTGEYKVYKDNTIKVSPKSSGIIPTESKDILQSDIVEDIQDSQILTMTTVRVNVEDPSIAMNSESDTNKKYAYPPSDGRYNGKNLDLALEVEKYLPPEIEVEVDENDAPNVPSENHGENMEIVEETASQMHEEHHGNEKNAKKFKRNKKTEQVIIPTPSNSRAQENTEIIAMDKTSGDVVTHIGGGSSDTENPKKRKSASSNPTSSSSSSSSSTKKKDHASGKSKSESKETAKEDKHKAPKKVKSEDKKEETIDMSSFIKKERTEEQQKAWESTLELMHKRKNKKDLKSQAMKDRAVERAKNPPTPLTDKEKLERKEDKIKKILSASLKKADIKKVCQRSGMKTIPSNVKSYMNLAMEEFIRKCVRAAFYHKESGGRKTISGSDMTRGMNRYTRVYSDVVA